MKMETGVGVGVGVVVDAGHAVAVRHPTPSGVI
jgi:hypothetical protein